MAKNYEIDILRAMDEAHRSSPEWGAHDFDQMRPYGDLEIIPPINKDWKRPPGVVIAPDGDGLVAAMLTTTRLVGNPAANAPRTRKVFAEQVVPCRDRADLAEALGCKLVLFCLQLKDLRRDSVGIVPFVAPLEWKASKLMHAAMVARPARRHIGKTEVEQLRHMGYTGGIRQVGRLIMDYNKDPAHTPKIPLPRTYDGK